MSDITFREDDAHLLWCPATRVRKTDGANSELSVNCLGRGCAVWSGLAPAWNMENGSVAYSFKRPANAVGDPIQRGTCGLINTPD